jgi:hypothetical protein
MAKQSVRRRPQKLKFKRKTYNLDAATMSDLSEIQLAFRVRTETDGVRIAVQKTAVLVRHVAAGGEINLVKGKSTTKLDVPGPGGA